MDLLGACKGLGDLGASGTEDNGSRGWSNVSTRVSSRVSVDDCSCASMTSSSSTLIGASLDLRSSTRFSRRSP